jgi:beta-phosphoglucomutase-like phosphatase (HAD superfamily)
MNPLNSIKNKNIKAILFDMDGVLVDSMNFHLKSWKELLGSFNVNVSEGILLGLVTSSRRNLIEKIWKKEELAYFSTIISSDDTDRFKPYPDPYLKAIQKIQQEPMNCLVIENAPAGIQSACSAGITCFAISSTLPEEKLSGAQQVFPTLGSLNNFLTKIIP